jgi:hypothetical protein
MRYNNLKINKALINNNFWKVNKKNVYYTKKNKR